MNKNLKYIFLSFLILIPFVSKSQSRDSLPITKLSVKGFCLCKTSLNDLKRIDPQIKQVEVEEMDLPKECFGKDSRYVAGSGFSLENQQGIIFQKDPESDFISKLRLTKQFKGKLPNGVYVDLSTLLLKDVLKMQPQLKKLWVSRGCSNYYQFSNDTIFFFIKIDPKKQPQFPVDEEFYLNKPIEAIDLIMSCYSFIGDKQEIVLFDPMEPVIFLDSIRVNIQVLKNYELSEISKIEVFKDSSAISKFGKEAKNGLIYFETKDFVRHHYWEYFTSKSIEYQKAVPSEDFDLNVQYILNGKVLKKDFEADLEKISDSTFKAIKVLSKNELFNKYKINNKQIGVVIFTNPPINIK